MRIEPRTPGAMSELEHNGGGLPARLARRLGQRWHWIALGSAGCLAFAAAVDATLAGVMLGLLAVVVAAMAVPMSGDRSQPAFPSRTGRGGGGRTGNDGWRAVVDAMPEAALVLDTTGIVVHLNGFVTDLFPHARAGQAISHLSRHPELIEAVDRALKARQPIKVLFQERIPVERRVSAAITVLDDGGRNGLPALLVTFRDLSEEDKLAQMRADFIANASHELRTPLASLRGFVETLQGPARDDAAARTRFLALMESQATRMTRLIDDLLSLSRVEMRVHLAPRGIVDLNEVAAYVAQTLEPLAHGSNTEIHVVRLDGPARIRGEREEIVQVLQNLVHNALKYGRPDGRVIVSVTRPEEWRSIAAPIAVSVADNGPGIAPEHLPRLTERFYRVNAASSREKGGTGLGLAIVKHIVNRHRSEMKIESRLGEGSTFTVFFNELC